MESSVIFVQTTETKVDLLSYLMWQSGYHETKHIRIDQKDTLLYFSASQLTLYILEELSPSSVFVGCSISATESKGQKTMAIYFIQF